MTEQEAIKWLKAISATQNSSIHKNSMSERKEAIQALEEIQQYREMEQRLQNVYGTCDGLLEKVVSHLEKHENTELPEPVFKAKLLIDDEVARGEAYKEIGSVEKMNILKEYADMPKVEINGKIYVDKELFIGLLNKRMLEEKKDCESDEERNAIDILRNIAANL